MRLRTVMLTWAMALAATACGNLGLGEADCSPLIRDISSANVLNVQAVPTAKYTPCLTELRLGWDSVDFFAESGRAGIEIEAGNASEPFLTATVTKSCDVGSARVVDSGYEDIERYEAVDFEPAQIGITIIPSGAEANSAARLLVEQLEGLDIDDRPVRPRLDDAINLSVTIRVDRALRQGNHVWIISELDAEEGTLELRSNNPAIAGRGIEPDAALDLIEENVARVHYRGHWYFIFEGGCITYRFDATGMLAETVAGDAADALGFYPAFELHQIAEDNGFDIRGDS